MDISCSCDLNCRQSTCNFFFFGPTHIIFQIGQCNLVIHDTQKKKKKKKKLKDAYKLMITK